MTAALRWAEHAPRHAVTTADASRSATTAHAAKPVHKSVAASHPATHVAATAAPPSGAQPTAVLGPGSTGAAVVALQQHLLALGYWVQGVSGYFDDSTEQAVWALQKAAGLDRDGVVGPQTWAALRRGVVPVPRTRSGYVIEVDLADDVLMIVDNGRLEHVLNTSTGGGYLYSTGSGTAVADTPTGVFHVYAAIDRMVTDSLGQLWRPRYFTGGFAIHGEGYVPAFPVSHGCVRVSDEAIDWIWADGIAPIGTTVDIYA